MSTSELFALAFLLAGCAHCAVPDGPTSAPPYGPTGRRTDGAIRGCVAPRARAPDAQTVGPSQLVPEAVQLNVSGPDALIGPTMTHARARLESQRHEVRGDAAVIIEI